MDYDRHDPPPGADAPAFRSPAYVMPHRQKKRSLWRIFTSLLFVLSILANVFLLLAVLAMATVMSPTALSDQIVETILVPGDRHQKIVTIHIDGIIDGRMSGWLNAQIEAAEKDPSVRGLIVCINSPGGGVAASDRIHHAISRYRKHTGKPVLAFMQSVAASGGYYSAVACDTIMAEPTAITGSIGVIMNHLVVKELLEEKLGINPVVIKSGQRKDWPSPFSDTTEEQRKYLDERIIQPAYERFVQLVYDGRQDKLTENQVRQLADGGIYTAPDALTRNLIDTVGYFEQAVDTLSKMAHLTDPMVVEYRERFSMWNLLNAQTDRGITLSADLLDRMLIPQVMYLWDGRP